VSFPEFISPLIGRLALAWYFLHAAVSYAGNWDATVSLMALKHIPAPPALLALALIVMFLGGISLVLGYHARYGAILLFGFTIAATLLMHDFWTILKAADQEADYEAFAANVAIAGGLLVIVGLGPGGLAIDNAGKKR
jgi:putative oxidoreductase